MVRKLTLSLESLRDRYPWFPDDHRAVDLLKPMNIAARHRFIRMLKDIEGLWDYDRICQYLEYHKAHPKDSSSRTHFILKYGETAGIPLYEAKLKTSACSGLEYLTNKYGSELGKVKHNELKQQRSHQASLQGFIDRYGSEEGPIRFQQWCDRNRGNLSLERMIELYGPEQGKARYEEVQYKLKNKNYEWYHCMLFGDEEGIRRYRERCAKNSESTKHMENAVWRVGTESYKRWLDRMVELGHARYPHERSAMHNYRADVWRYTRAQPLELLPNFEKHSPDWHIDHIISIRYGFDHNIPAEVIGNIDNLQIIPASVNIEKKAQCYEILEHCNRSKINPERIDEYV